MLRLRYQRHCCRFRRGKSKASAIRRLRLRRRRRFTIERLFPDNGRFRLTHRITSRTTQVPGSDIVRDPRRSARSDYATRATRVTRDLLSRARALVLNCQLMKDR